MRITLNNILNKFYKLKNKRFIIALLFILTISNATAQRGVRIGYIDTEYILQNVSEYQAAQTQLENKALKWKAEIDQRKAELETKKQQLNNERVLLTIDLIDEREKELDIGIPTKKIWTNWRFNDSKKTTYPANSRSNFYSCTRNSNYKKI